MKPRLIIAFDGEISPKELQDLFVLKFVGYPDIAYNVPIPPLDTYKFIAFGFDNFTFVDKIKEYCQRRNFPYRIAVAFGYEQNSTGYTCQGEIVYLWTEQLEEEITVVKNKAGASISSLEKVKIEGEKPEHFVSRLLSKDYSLIVRNKLPVKQPTRLKKTTDIEELK